MASKPNEDNTNIEEDNAVAVPRSIIAQAEAAIIGEFEDDNRELSRRPSRAPKPDYSQYQSVHRNGGESSAG
jgi:hypothetical protein